MKFNKDIESFLLQRMQEEGKDSLQRIANELLRKYAEMEKRLLSQKLSDDIQRIGNRAVRKAQADNHAKGLPNVYSKNGVIYWQLPDGTVTMKSPFEVEKK